MHIAVKESKESKQPVSSDEVPFSFFGVYDGHGGRLAAEYVADNLLKIFIVKLKEAKGNYKDAIELALAQVETDFLMKSQKEQLTDGTTAAIAIFHEDKLYVANVGDSEMILSRTDGEVLTLTEVHNPKKNVDEGARVEAVGGRLFHDRVGHPKLNPAYVSIAVSRAIGDAFFKQKEYTEGKPSGLIATPFVKEVTLTVKDQLCVLACDGVWDVCKPKEVADFVSQALKKGIPVQKVSEQLVQYAFDKGSTDNITALIVTLQPIK